MRSSSAPCATSSGVPSSASAPSSPSSRTANRHRQHGARRPLGEAGLRAGDIIKEIDGKSTENWTSNAGRAEAARRKGHRGGGGGAAHGLSRACCGSASPAARSLNSVYYSFMLKPHHRLHHHQGLRRDHLREFERAVRSLKGQGMTSLILDLRFNGGGLLDRPWASAASCWGQRADRHPARPGRQGRGGDPHPQGLQHGSPAHGGADQPRLGPRPRRSSPARSRTTTAAWWWARSAGARAWSRR